MLKNASRQDSRSAKRCFTSFFSDFTGTNTNVLYRGTIWLKSIINSLE
jgi:hypothetical protein